MDSGEGYHQDIEFKVNIKKHLSGDIVLAVSCDSDDMMSSNTFSPDGDISGGLELLGITMRRHYDSKHKEKFLKWVSEGQYSG